MRHPIRAQLFTLDLFIAVFVFIILISSVMFVWNRYSIRLNEDLVYKELELKAFQISDLFVKTLGRPNVWEQDPSSAEIIGLAYTNRNLSEPKITALLNLSYNTSRNIIDPYHHFYFQIKSINGSNLTEPYGKYPDGEFLVKTNRLVLYKNEEAVMQLTLWE